MSGIGKNKAREHNGGSQQFNGREGETATLLWMAFGELGVARIRFRPTSSQPFYCFLKIIAMKTLSSLLLILIFVSGFTFAQGKSNAEYLKLAEQGDAVAQNELGVRIAEGTGTKLNNKVAVEWFRKSAAQGNALGACNFGVHYARGAGIKKNKVLAFKWFYIANSLDSLKCHPSDYLNFFRISKAQDKTAWKNALVWLKAHPDLADNFGRRPWLKDKTQ